MLGAVTVLSVCRQGDDKSYSYVYEIINWPVERTNRFSANLSSGIVSKKLCPGRSALYLRLII